MSKQPKWKIWPKEMYKTFVAIGICSALLGAILPIVSTEIDSKKTATMLHWAGICFAIGGALVLAIAGIGFALERWQKKH